MNPTMTLRAIKACNPCVPGWRRGLAALGPDLDAPISLSDIATSNSAADALWCIRTLDWSDIAVRRAVVSGALMPAIRRAVRHIRNKRVHEGVSTLDRWCAGDDGVDLDLYAAARAAHALTQDAAYAVTYAAYAADAANATDAAKSASYAAAYAADAAKSDSYVITYNAYTADVAAEYEQQRADIIVAFPPVRLTGSP